MKFIFIILFTFVYTQPEFEMSNIVDRCKNNCHTLFMQYGISGEHDTGEEYPEDVYDVKNSGIFLGYSYNLFNLFKRKKIGIDLGAVINIDKVNYIWDNGVIQQELYYDSSSIYFQLKYKIIPQFILWSKTYRKSFSSSGNFDRYLTRGMSAGFSLNIFDNYLVTADASLFNVNRNDNIVGFNRLRLYSINLGYKF